MLCPPRSPLRVVDRRPWGWMVTLIGTGRFWLKLIRVRRGSRTSLQYHLRRSELHLSFRHGWKWVPRGKVHRMTAGVYLELAFGVPRETDIVRLADDFNRADFGRV